jgi:hypothetical protein
MFWWGKILWSTLKIVAKVPSVKFNFTSYRYHGYYSPNKYGFISNATWRTSNMLSNLWGFIATSFWGLFD